MVITCWVVLFLLLDLKNILLFPKAKPSACYNISSYYFNAANVLNHWLIINSHSIIIINKLTIYIYSLNSNWLLSAIVRSLSANILLFSYILWLTSVHLDILTEFSLWFLLQNIWNFPKNLRHWLRGDLSLLFWFQMKWNNNKGRPKTSVLLRFQIKWYNSNGRRNVIGIRLKADHLRRKYRASPPLRKIKRNFQTS